MQQISPDKLMCGYGDPAIPVASGFSVTKSDLSIVKSLDPVVGYGDFKDILGKIFNRLMSGADWGNTNIPIRIPGFGIDQVKKPFIFPSAADLRR